MCHSDPRTFKNIVLINIYIINTKLMSKEEKKVNRRDFLFTASYTIGGSWPRSSCLAFSSPNESR